MASSSSSSSSCTRMGEYITAPFTPYYFEEELTEDLKLDDAQVLEKRYRERRRGEQPTISSSSIVPPSSSNAVKERKSVKSQTQWTRALDAVQEHFSSHVTLDGISHKLPPIIYALKLTAKHNWILYKKRECERRKRIRRKIEREKLNEKNGKPSNVLMAMVDMCESCKRLYVTVNLFWGVTLCDSCYFNPGILQDIMSARIDVANQKIQITPENIVQEVVRFRKNIENQSFFSIRNNNNDPPSSLPPPPPPKPTTTTSSPLSKKEEEEEEDDASIAAAVALSQFLEVPLPPSPPPTSPGGSPGNALEKTEVAEAILKNQDSPFEQDILFNNEEDEDEDEGEEKEKEKEVKEEVEKDMDFRFTPSPPPSGPNTPATASLALFEDDKEEEEENFSSSQQRDLFYMPLTPSSFSTSYKFSQQYSSQGFSSWSFDSTNSRAFHP